MSYFDESDFPFKNFSKLAKQAETTRNYQKQILVMIKYCYEKLIRFQSRKFSCKSFIDKLEEMQNLTRIIRSQREIKVLFSTLKNSPFPLTQNKNLKVSYSYRLEFRGISLEI